MTIRLAIIADIDRIVAMSLRFQQTVYATHLRATSDTLAALAFGMIQNQEANIWLAEHDGVVQGMLAAAIYTQPMSGERIGTEICWWMEPESRGGRAALQLLRTAERWAASRGATTFQMMAPQGATDVGRFYEALKYEPIETHYQRRIA